MNAIEVKTGGAYWKRIGLLWGMFGFIGLVMEAMARRPALGILGLVLMVAPAYMLWSRRVWWIARMDADGVTLRSGKRYAWSDFEKIVDVHAVRGGAKWHNHYELIFKSGRARIFDRMLANADEVLAVVKALERSENPFTEARGKQA
jgi:hypothetical protein